LKKCTRGGFDGKKYYAIGKEEDIAALDKFLKMSRVLNPIEADIAIIFDAVKPADNAVKPADNAVKPAENSASTQSESKNESKVAAPVIAAKKIKVINCVKGKLKRKISGVSPKCPAGFVKK
jgi:hypothetical protein